MNKWVDGVDLIKRQVQLKYLGLGSFWVSCSICVDVSVMVVVVVVYVGNVFLLLATNNVAGFSIEMTNSCVLTIVVCVSVCVFAYDVLFVCYLRF